MGCISCLYGFKTRIAYGFEAEYLELPSEIDFVVMMQAHCLYLYYFCLRFATYSSVSRSLLVYGNCSGHRLVCVTTFSSGP